MKDLIIKNINDIQPNVVDRDENTFSIKSVVSGDDIDTC